MSPAAVLSAMNRLVPEDAVIAVDVGNNTYSFGRYFECKSQSILVSGYLGSIGYAYPAAIGAEVAAQHRPILAVTCDGGFAQYKGDLTTAVKCGFPIKHILLNNVQLGKISRQQRNEGKAFGPHPCTILISRVMQKTTVHWVFGFQLPLAWKTLLKMVLDHDGPALLELMTDAELT